MTDAGRALRRHLRGRRFERCKFRRQYQLSTFIVDFVCLAAGLIIELDGGLHLQNMAEDAERTEALNRLGFRVIRFWNDDVLVRTDAVLEEIFGPLTKVPLTLSPPGSGRQVRCGLELSNEHVD